ncbi:hypothetical protein, partial [Yersinia mollaretii]|uniref:hypothetical protein n=1 Tax=Yersinia mollaretii TaxID=33060 RepID=UPI001C0FBBF1
MRLVLGSVMGSVDMRLVFTLTPMPQPPKGAAAPLWNPALCAKYCGYAIPSGSLPANRTGADSLPARQPLSP